jgi:hypothetical protein
MSGRFAGNDHQQPAAANLQSDATGQKLLAENVSVRLVRRIDIGIEAGSIHRHGPDMKFDWQRATVGWKETIRKNLSVAANDEHAIARG